MQRGVACRPARVTGKGFRARVRVEAVMALGATADAATHWAGLDHLLRALRARALDPATQQPRARHFASLAEFFVDQARPAAGTPNPPG